MVERVNGVSAGLGPAEGDHETSFRALVGSDRPRGPVLLMDCSTAHDLTGWADPSISRLYSGTWLVFG